MWTVALDRVTKLPSKLTRAIEIAATVINPITTGGLIANRIALVVPGLEALRGEFNGSALRPTRTDITELPPVPLLVEKWPRTVPVFDAFVKYAPG